MTRNMDFSDVAETVASRARFVSSKEGVDICVCGHSQGSHASQKVAGFTGEACKAGAIRCACVKYRGVLRVSNAKTFRYKTGGSAANHPLTLGLFGAQSKHGATVVPLEGYTCGVVGCDSETRLWPMLWDSSVGGPTSLDLGETMLVCEEHLIQNGFGHVIPGADSESLDD